MKKAILFSSILVFIYASLPGQIQHLEPQYWWAGMKNSNLQLMVHGKNIAETRVELQQYAGVTLLSESRVENPNFLFLDLRIAPDVRPWKFQIFFREKEKIIASYNYELKERQPGSAAREGFNNSDVMYLIMPDRFANGNTDNDDFSDMPDKADRRNPNGRHGGDIMGIIDHLDYIKKMGFTAIWLNPVLENNQEQYSYHGYSATDFYKIDKRFGSNEDYILLGELASKNGIKIIMDMIFNHCGSEHWWMKDMPAPDWINFYPEYANTNHRHTVNMDPHASEYDTRLMTDGWFVPSMPDMNQKNPFLANYLIQNSIWWIEMTGLSGIRMDTYPYPDKYMMAEWTRRVMEEYPAFNIVGEEWSIDPAIVSYWQKGKVNKDGYDGGLPSLMDFPLQSALSRALTEEEVWGSGLIRLYEALAMDFLYPDPDNLVIFSDNHDMPRFYMQLGMDAGLYKLGITYLLTTRGIPQIFYGSEVLMTHTGSNEHGYIRKDFTGGWDGDKVSAFTEQGLSEQELDMQRFFRQLLNWRKDNPVVQYGSLTHFATENGVYVYFRHLESKSIMVMLNKNRKDTKLTTDRFREMIGSCTHGKDVISGRIFELKDSLTVPALTPLILELE